MANSKSAKSFGVVMNIPECPVCMRNMSIPIYQCKSGHSVCHICTQALIPPLCPICRQDMTQIRNLQLEEIISKVKVPCVNKEFGCIYTTVSADAEDHLKECIFRRMDCPLGVVLGKCSWNGRLNKMMDHFKEHHPKNCNLNSDVDVEIDKVDLKENERYVYLLSHQNKFLFIMTFKIDIMQRIAYWVIQHIGPKKNAQQYVYEIHVTSKINNKRKYVYTETCFNDALKADEVFHRGQCPVMLLDTLAHFIKHRKLAFRFFIKRIPTNQPNKSDGNGNDDNQKGNDTPHKGPKGPGPKGPVSKGAGSKTSVPGPKKSQKSSN